MNPRHPRLEGKVAIVTGAGTSAPEPPVGTGRAISILFAREGARVLLVDRVIGQAEETLASIREEGSEASVFEGDITRAANCRAMVEAAHDRYGGLNILANNAGIFVPEGSVVDVEEEVWDRVLDVNLKGMMLTSKFAVPRMIQGGGGSIINISSVGGLRGSRRSRVSYNTSKGGVIALSQTMAAQHSRDKVRVNCIAPGSINTPMAPNEMGSPAVRASSLGTIGTGWDVAWAAVFLASDEARWITGIVLPVDAGQTIMTPSAVLLDSR